MRTPSWQLLCGAAFLATGAALLAYIASGISLLWTALFIGMLAAALLAGIARRLNDSKRLFLKRRIAAGLIGGVVATAAYDASRFALIKITGIHFWPFDIFRVFGQALLGPNFNSGVTRAAGLVYHILSGLSFGIAYSIVLGARGVPAGIAFAMCLELFMVTVYPGWLHMKALQEFLQVSVFGHLIYGSVLGYLAKRLIARQAG
jgi:hypothetical protein